MADIIDIVTSDHQPIYRDGIKRLLESEPDFRAVSAGKNSAPARLRARRLFCTCSDRGRQRPRTECLFRRRRPAV